MSSLDFGISSYERGRGDLPALPVHNMFAEEAPTEETGVVLQSRPGLDDRESSMGSEPVESLFQRDLVLSSALFGVSGSETSGFHLYRETTDLGEIDGTGPFSMAGYENYLFVTGGTSLWLWNGTTLSQVAIPDDASVAKVVVGASRALIIRKDTGKFYWSDPLETDFEALDFATAENQPDRLLDILFHNDAALLFGKETVEIWPNAQDDDLPFQPQEMLVIEKGVRATGCATLFGSTFAWVTNGNQVCIESEGNIISNPGLEERIEVSETCRLWSFTLGGYDFLALRIDNETQVWNLRSRQWSEFGSYNEDNWIPQCFAGGVFGSSLDGSTSEWGSGHQDFGDVLPRWFRAWLPINSGGFAVDNVQIRTNVGQSPFLEGDYQDPTVEMRISRDGGHTWGLWDGVSLGEAGSYRTRAQWRGCGQASQPGFLAEFRVVDPAPWRVSDVLVNEPWGGR